MQEKCPAGTTHNIEGYAGLSYSLREKDGIIKYIISQQEHHKKINEYKAFIKEMGLEFDERDWGR